LKVSSLTKPPHHSTGTNPVTNEIVSAPYGSPALSG
jgi:hypothetical protein